MLTAATATEALRLSATQSPDAILLDLGLPDKDGKEVIREVRGLAIPIIVLSARDRETEKIDALDLGADDYVNKPFGIGELLARIRAARETSDKPVQTVFRAGGLTIDTERHSVDRDGVHVKLTPKEFDLLLLLVRNAGRVLTHSRSSTRSGAPPIPRTSSICASSWDSCARRSKSSPMSLNWSLQSQALGTG